MFNFNLQLFSDDDSEMEDVFDDEEVFEDEDLEEEIEDEELDDEPEEEEEPREPQDKKTKAIIKQKKENKELKIKLQELEDQLQAKELEKETNERILELTREGKSSQEATKIAKSEGEVKALRMQLARHEINNLEASYPGINTFARQLAEDKQKLPEFSYEQLYLAKYAKVNKYDEKTRLEQELLYKNKEARKKSLGGSNVKAPKTITLSKEDERVYRYLKKGNPKMTKKQFVELLEADSLE